MCIFSSKINLFIFIDKERAVANTEDFVYLAENVTGNLFESLRKVLSLHENLVELIVPQTERGSVAVDTNDATVAAWIIYDAGWLVHVRFWLLVDDSTSWVYLTPRIN